MTHHNLKIWPQYFGAVVDGNKTFEIRKNDRGFQKGDTVTLFEFDTTMVDVGTNSGDEPRGYTGKNKTFKIGYVLPIDSERVVFSLLQVSPTPGI